MLKRVKLFISRSKILAKRSKFSTEVGLRPPAASVSAGMLVVMSMCPPDCVSPRLLGLPPLAVLLPAVQLLQL